MSQGNTSAELYQIELEQVRIAMRPLFGLSRLVKLQHRNRNGILYCDNVMRMSESISFAPDNTRTSRCSISISTTMGALGEPRMSAPNEATADDLTRFRDDGTETAFLFTPKTGATFAMECDMYKAYDAGHRYVRLRASDESRIAKWRLILDVSAYLEAGFSIVNPRCEYESCGAADSGAARARARRLDAVEKGGGLWEWSVDDVAGGDNAGMAWEVERAPAAHDASPVGYLEKLATELSVNPRLAKDLHNFVIICHYFVAGARSLSKIGPEMMTSKSALNWSLDSLETAIGTELIQRTKGKGLILVTPAGEAVLDWWSQFYMRWTPISPSLTQPSE